jgi:uncharacterized membrane protein (TIGR02234 family)
MTDAAAASPAGDGGPGRARRQYAAALLAGLTAAAAVAVGVSRPWLTAAATPPGLPRIETTVTGAELAPLLGALGLVLLAAFGAVLATRGLARRVVGLLIAGCAAVVVGAALREGDGTGALRAGLAAKGWAPPAPYDVSAEPWRWLVVAGGATCLAAGIGVVWRGAAWPTMGRRYDAPATATGPTSPGPDSTIGEELGEEALWRALDEGRDPTRRP